jgi:hypothetical protein
MSKRKKKKKKRIKTPKTATNKQRYTKHYSKEVTKQIPKIWSKFTLFSEVNWPD